jgi:cation-transporting ATPase E
VPCPVSDELEEEIRIHAQKGERVLLLAKLATLDSVGEAIAMIAISDRIRPSAKETIAKFQDQGVTIKIISGDHAATVSTIAGRVGINNSEKFLSCESITDEELILSAEKYTVFGRVTPEQKVLLIKTLKTNGHVVAMTGDGVNDTLALKESNCAIAMADGSEVARKVSQIVLLNSDFGTLPDVVREGRRCINNVRQSAVLYLMKTLFIIAISLLVPFTVSSFPLTPKQLALLEFAVIGVPSFLLAFEPNNKRIEGSFLDSAIVRSIPNAIALIAPVFSLLILGKFMPSDARNAMAMALVTIIGFINLMCLCTPFTKWRAAVVSLSAILITGVTLASIFLLNDMFNLAPLLDNIVIFILVLTASLFISITMQIFRGKIEKFIQGRIDKQRKRREEYRARA